MPLLVRPKPIARQLTLLAASSCWIVAPISGSMVLHSLRGETRQDEYYKWSEWQRYLACHKAWADYRSKVDANSIFFPEGFTEKFRRLDELIIASNVEFEHRILRISANVTDDFGNVTGCGGRCWVAPI